MKKPDASRMEQNLKATIEVTVLCLELRKAVLKQETGISDDNELNKMVYAEAVKNKEKKWESAKI